MTTSAVTQADLEKTAEELGEKAGFLLAAAPWPDDVKAAWVHLIDEMSTDEIGEFTELLEFLFADSMTADIDDEFKKQTDAVRHTQASSQQEALAQLDALHARVRARIST
ncbi:MAG: hypothetical protein A3C15_01695 [Candidatus Magasanikbacteria bacterium RIFCSPHIGHO2_02_FULL_50_9b]|uniref:Uncharacterized protein n=1 Tax=Candidatus Magasanikbacteria bacterium RIFCSPHIGHO2_02_FULL_50_9b TaxID=1798682 RepID=A0A1F6M8E0_9BACT|nr:MAG: hypothetical protein A3C15_01695 [Candidatus Magasanikbacteria bacterium RIFCSPHIGHO2_02_FULL_50_9b]